MYFKPKLRICFNRDSSFYLFPYNCIFNLNFNKHGKIMKNKHLFLLFAFIVTLTSFGHLFGQPKSSVKHPSWSYNETIYEVNVRQFSQEGTFKAVEKEIPRLKELGIGILWLMPIHPIGEKNRKGTLGSYYSVRDYLAVDSSYGTINDLKSLTNTAHQNGMYLIIDWVANHTSWDNKLIVEHPEYYTKDSAGNIVSPVADWHDVADLNFEVPAVREYMLNALKFWVKECNIDGYRCDVADKVPVDFWNKVRVELDKIKPVFMLAEAENPEHHKKAFDMSYSWQLHHLFNDISKGKKNAKAITEYFYREQKRFPADAFRMRFTSNHDENSWNGTEFERMGDAAPTFAVFTTVFPGMPLVYNGQEVGLTKRLEFFEKDPIQWNDSKFKDLYTTYLNLKKTNKALLNGIQGGKLNIIKSDNDTTIFAFSRAKGKDKVVAVFNLSPREVTVKLSGKSLAGTYKLNGTEITLKSSESATLKPWEYRVYIK